MLARLDGIPGVAQSRVDWSGRRFLLTLEGTASRGLVETEASSALGEGARLLDDVETREVLVSYRKGEAWMRAGETLQLSRFEAGILAKRYADEVAGELGLDEPRAGKLAVVFQKELERAFERTHAGQGIEILPVEFEAAARRIQDACAGFLDGEQLAGLADYLKRFAGDGAR